MTWAVKNLQAYNDEFDGYSLSSLWSGNSVSNMATITYNTNLKSCMGMYASGNQIQWMNMPVSPGASTAFSVTMKAGWTAGSSAGVALFVNDIDWPSSGGGTATNGLCLAHNYGVWNGYVGTTGTWNWGYASLSTFNRMDTCYIHMQRDASDNWTCWGSFDARSWLRVMSLNKAFTVGRVMPNMNQNGYATPVWGYYDWIRFNWITL